MSEYAHPEVLVETDWLEQNLSDDSIVVVEVDEDPDAYLKGHIPGAVELNWETELQALPQRQFVSAEELASLLGEKGISDDHTIVLYGGNNNWFTTYAYWLLKYRGIDNVKLLNGGRKKWELESRELTQDEPSRPVASFTPGTDRPELRIFRDEVITRAATGTAAWVDVEVTRGVPRRGPRSSAPSAGAVAGPGPHPGRVQHHVVEGGQRGRHVQVCR